MEDKLKKILDDFDKNLTAYNPNDKEYIPFRDLAIKEIKQLINLEKKKAYQRGISRGVKVAEIIRGRK